LFELFRVVCVDAPIQSCVVMVDVPIQLPGVCMVCGLELFWVFYLSYGPPWAHYLGGYQDRLLGRPLGLPGLRYTVPEGVEHKDSEGVVLG
jgi:hypothetical protein